MHTRTRACMEYTARAHSHSQMHSKNFLFLKSETSITICGEDFFDWINVCGRSQIQAQIVFHGRFHDSTSWTLHRVIQSRMYDILFRCTRNTLLKWFRWSHGYFATNTSKTTFQWFLHRFYKLITRTGKRTRTPKYINKSFSFECKMHWHEKLSLLSRGDKIN